MVSTNILLVAYSVKFSGQTKMNKRKEIFESEDAYLKWLRKSKGLSQTTVYHYYTYYKEFVKWDLDQDNINKYIQKRKNNFVVRSFMKSFLEFLKVSDQYMIMKKPTGTIKKRIIRDYTQDQIKKVSAYCYKKSLRHGLMFDILYHGALRLDELISINVNSFDWDGYFNDPSKHCKLVVIGKGKKHRPVLIPPATMDRLLESYLANGLITGDLSKSDLIDKLSVIDDPLFHNLYGKRIWLDIKNNSERSIGIAIRPHEIRHTRATELEKQGASIRSIQHYLGHSTPQITEIYLHTTQKASLESIREIVD